MLRIIISYFFSCIFSPVAMSQGNEEIKESFVLKLAEQYNKSEYENIFESFSIEMKEALPKDKALLFLSGLKSQAGKIADAKLMQTNGFSRLYKTKFENGLFVVDIALNESLQIAGLMVKPYVENLLRNQTEIILPFDGEWTVFWGGGLKEQNYHVDSQAQRGAFDFVITDDVGKTYQTDGLANGDYFAFGKEIFSPCDGVVVLAVDGIYDNKPQKMNPFYAFGNSVVIKTDKNEYVLLAHLKKHSVLLKEDERVSKGQLVGLCGNSGNSSEAHLHFHIQNGENISESAGIKCYFENIIVNGEQQDEYSPVRGDKVEKRK